MLLLRRHRWRGDCDALNAPLPRSPARSPCRRWLGQPPDADRVGRMARAVSHGRHRDPLDGSIVVGRQWIRPWSPMSTATGGNRTRDRSGPGDRQPATMRALCACGRCGAHGARGSHAPSSIPPQRGDLPPGRRGRLAAHRGRGSREDRASLAGGGGGDHRQPEARRLLRRARPAGRLTAVDDRDGPRAHRDPRTAARPVPAPARRGRAAGPRRSCRRLPASSAA